MARRRARDDDGFERLPGLKELPQVRDSMGKTQIPTNFTISGNPSPTLTESPSIDPSLSTFYAGIRHWSRFESIARQVSQMKRRNPTRTAPELLTNLLLNQRGISFIEQVPILGGKMASGGAVIDFVLPNRGLALALHGHYYHPIQEARVEWIRYIGQTAFGIEIRDYKFLVDTTLYRLEDGRALDFTLAGIQLD